MPDWSYRTLFRPALFRLTSRQARDLTLLAIGGLGKLPWGSAVIRTLGHLDTSPLLQTKLADVQLKSPLGLSGGLDIHGTANKALSQFGFGFLEIGPITMDKITSDLPIQRDLQREAIIYPIEYENDGVEAITAQLKQNHKNKGKLPCMLRLKHSPESTLEHAIGEHQLLLDKLVPFADGFYIDLLDHRWSLEHILEKLDSFIQVSRSIIATKPLFLYVPLDYPLDKLQQLTQHSTTLQWDGIVIGDMIHTDNGLEIGHEGKQLSIEKVRLLRGQLEVEHILIATAGIHEPQDALDWYSVRSIGQIWTEEGATLVEGCIDNFLRSWFR